MNFSKKNHEIARQNDLNVKKPQKHDVNLQKNTTLHFQIGLILCLLFTYTMFDLQFLTADSNFTSMENDPEIPEILNINYTVEPKFVPEPPKPVKRRQLLSMVIKPIEDNVKLKKELPIIDVPETLPKVSTKAVVKKIPPVVAPPTFVDINAVEQVPIFPGCEGLSTNIERKACMSKKITKHVQRKFNTDIASDLGLSGKQRIYVQFKIDKMGNVTEIKSRSPHSRLQNEATRVIDKLPQMEPGKQQKQNVTVMYTLPITFQVFD